MYRFSVSFTATRPLSCAGLSGPRSNALGHNHSYSSYGSLQKSLLSGIPLPALWCDKEAAPSLQQYARQSDSATKSSLPQCESQPSLEDEDHATPGSKVLLTPNAISPGPAAPAVAAHDTAFAKNQNKVNSSNFAGFWSLESYHQNESYTKHGCAPSRDEQEQAGHGRAEPDLFQERWSAVPRPGKIDLSYWNILKGEAHRTRPSIDKEEQHLAFRTDGDSASDRSITKFFMQHIYNQVSADDGLPDELAQALMHHPAVINRPERLTRLSEILNWSWILLPDSTTSVKRLVVLTRQREAKSLSPPPLWLIMQLLRSANIDAKSLTELIELVRDRTHYWSWSGTEPMLLTIRLLRHARRSAPTCFKEIVNLFLDLLRKHPSTHSTIERKKICHWCNRVLSLLAIPTSVTPFRSMRAQQAGQLVLIRYMQECQPQIPLTREGYRAIARVQLMHEKTEQEKEWARAKALTWPPWERQNQMGSVAKPADYPGKRSRVVKVLERMQETGYAPYSYDLAIRILTGWDTDDSPTIQVRRTGASISVPSPWLPEPTLVSDAQSPLIWSARVEATRTVREAWMCFCSYHAATQGNPQSIRVYHAMFQKLYARTLADSEEGRLPGDGKEVHSDPKLARDRVYIPEEIPSVQDFFSRMIAQKVRPTARLLGDLLRHESSLHQGLHYVSHADIEDKKRKVIASPQNYTSSVVADSLAALPGYLVKSYVGLLARPHSLKKQTVRPLFDGTSGPPFTKLLLEKMGLREVSIWNEYLHSLELHTRSSQPYYHKDSLPTVWGLVCDVVRTIQRTVPIDFTTFTYVATIAFKSQTSAKAEFFQTTSTDPVSITKDLFQRATCKDGDMNHADQWQKFCMMQGQIDVLHSIPTGDAIEAMVWVLGSAHTQSVVKDILALLHWVRRHQDQIAAAGYRLSMHNLAACRVFLEGSWADEEIWQTLEEDSDVATAEQCAEAQALVEELGTWPDDSYMERYLLSLESRFQRVRNKYKSSRYDNASHESDG